MHFGHVLTVVVKPWSVLCVLCQYLRTQLYLSSLSQIEEINEDAQKTLELEKHSTELRKNLEQKRCLCVILTDKYDIYTLWFHMHSMIVRTSRSVYSYKELKTKIHEELKPQISELKVHALQDIEKSL